MPKEQPMKVITVGTINISKMPQSKRDFLCAWLMEAMERFYSDPANMAGFLEWEANLEKEKEDQHGSNNQHLYPVV